MNKFQPAVLDRGDVSSLVRPWEMGADGTMRPPLDRDAMHLSVILSGDCYEMNTAPWTDSGWQDVTLRINGELIGSQPTHDDFIGSIREKLKSNYLFSFLKRQNPFRQVLETLHHKNNGDTGKAIIMAHPAPDGRTVIAIGFMGTGAQLYDWFSNFRMQLTEGTHTGFLKLVQQFEADENDILFPETAKRLGLKRLSLRDILMSMRQPGSPFVLWLTGHSQGGALTQIYCRRKIVGDGILPQYVVGYGFASPTVMASSAEEHPADYPIYHVVNSDDTVPRMGSQVHLGLLLCYKSDEALRRTCYGWQWDEESVRRRSLVRPLVEDMQSTGSFLIGFMGFIRALEGRSIEDVEAVLKVGGWQDNPVVKKALDLADSGYDRLLRFAFRRFAYDYESILGDKVPMRRVNAAAKRANEMIALLGIKGFMGTFNQMNLPAHSCCNDADHPNGVYQYIVEHGFDELQCAKWLSGTRPCRVAITPAAPRNRRASRSPRRAYRVKTRRGLRS
ncbi:MAG: hypothetical protein Q4C54_08230 [Clostridia bacterium]|nr:hypothetical protein [Clostridia bacterium]